MANVALFSTVLSLSGQETFLPGTLQALFKTVCPNPIASRHWDSGAMSVGIAPHEQVNETITWQTLLCHSQGDLGY